MTDMTMRDTRIFEAEQEIISTLRPMLNFPLSTDWWATRELLCEIKNSCIRAISLFDSARVEEEIANGTRQRFVPPKPAPLATSARPTLADLDF